MRIIVILAAVVVAATAQAPAAQAKTCKDPMTVSSRSTVQGGESARTKRATNNAQNKWNKEAKTKYGFQYQFWLRADAKTVDCRQTPKSTVCTATGSPCSLL